MTHETTACAARLAAIAEATLTLARERDGWLPTGCEDWVALLRPRLPAAAWRCPLAAVEPAYAPSPRVAAMALEGPADLSRLVLWYESDDDWQPAARHAGACQVAFCDGSVRGVAAAELPALMPWLTPPEAWWHDEPDPLARLAAQAAAHAVVRAARSLAGIDDVRLDAFQRGRLAAFALFCDVHLADSDDHLERAQRLIDQSGGDVARLFGAGGQLCRLDWLDESELILREAVRLSPDRWTHHQLGVTLFRLDRLDEAAEQFSLAIESAPDHHPARRALAESLMRLNRYDDAIAAYRAYLDGCPVDADAWLELAVCESQVQQTDADYTAYRRAEEAGAEPGNLYYNWAISARWRGDRERLVWCRERLAETNPGICSIPYVEAWIAAHDGDLSRAVALGSEAVRQAIDQQEPETAERMVTRILQMAAESNCHEGVAELAALAYQADLLSPAALFHLRELWGEPSDRAKAFTVLINVGNRAEGYFQTAFVLARSRADARRQTAAMLGRMGLKVASVEVRQEWEREPDVRLGLCEIRPGRTRYRE